MLNSHNASLSAFSQMLDPEELVLEDADASPLQPHNNLRNLLIIGKDHDPQQQRYIVVNMPAGSHRAGMTTQELLAEALTSGRLRIESSLKF